jgi:hypothetical protein
VKKLLEPPTFIQPRVIANGHKYEPHPYYPPKKKVITPEIIEKKDYEILY